MANDPAHAVPDFGPVIAREYLLDVARTQSPELTLICAPPGYGKSVLASQLASLSPGDGVWWVAMYDSDIRGAEWLAHVVAVLDPDGVVEDGGIASMLLLASSKTGADALLRIRDGLRRFESQSITVVLDGINRVDGLGLFEDLAGLIRRCTSSASRLVVTCRSIVCSDGVPDPSDVWLIGEDDLRFDRPEVLKLLARVGSHEGEDEEAQRLIDRFAGHPALTSVMLRHARIDDCSDSPQDLMWYTQRLVSQLPDQALPILYCAALLHEGQSYELDECLPSSRDVTAGWDAARAAAPLFNILRDDGQPTAFRMHAVLCEATLSHLPCRLGEDIARELRRRVLTNLAHVQDCARLHSVLVTVCEEAEVSSWCETHGAAMLRFLGPAAVERCLSRVSPPIMATNARLLLLRAAALRERERIPDALTHASLARRMAEADSDLATQSTATLLEVRLALDDCDLVKARSALEQLRGPLWDHLDASAACLSEAYSAMLDAYAWESEPARLHLEKATDLLVRVEAGSQEAVLATNCIAGVEGTLRGRWDRAGAVLTRMSTWPRLSVLQSLLWRANASVAHLEMGSPVEAKRLLDGALIDARQAGLHALEAYALGTWSDASWDDNRAESRGDFAASQRMLAEHGDSLGKAGGQIQRAMLCRSAGLNDESLAFAEAALAGLCDGGDSLRTLALAAEIEVAASLLALGDAWGARRTIEGISDRLVGSGACAHMLCADMVLAEADRLEGQVAAAVARIKPHSEYVSTGSANWRIAMYIRAFPGLLGVFCSAICPENLPLRMLRLIPTDTLESALGHADCFVRAEDRGVVSARILGKTESPAQPPLEDAPAAPCYVRLFGGLAVTTESGPVDDQHWRKRKARLLFAMLVTRQGQDLPVDVIMERLWPDMDEERAKRNFYVTWSTMKRALACGAAPSRSSHLVRYSGGVCRIARSVRSELDDFDDAVGRLRMAAVARDGDEVLSAARDLGGIYRGDLLPGDIYEEWFAEVRERTKLDFCDAMMTGAHAAESRSEFDTALMLLRRASVADPWREDVYQSMMRCQISAGQRSRAIETYLSCRSKLVDDLGIDPSSETTRLYQAVLAMEEDGGHESPGANPSGLVLGQV